MRVRACIGGAGMYAVNRMVQGADSGRGTHARWRMDRETMLGQRGETGVGDSAVRQPLLGPGDHLGDVAQEGSPRLSPWDRGRPAGSLGRRDRMGAETGAMWFA